MEQLNMHSKLEAKRDLIARLDRAIELALDLERQVMNMALIVEEHHTQPLAA